MRAFSDDSGLTWDVVVGRESWGAFFAIFIPRAPGADGEARTGDPGAAEAVPPDVRQTPLQASGYDEANGELEAMSDDGLRELLRRSAPKA